MLVGLSSSLFFSYISFSVIGYERQKKGHRKSRHSISCLYMFEKKEPVKIICVLHATMCFSFLVVEVLEPEVVCLSTELRAA
jgi:hypothetical protein